MSHSYEEDEDDEVEEEPSCCDNDDRSYMKDEGFEEKQEVLKEEEVVMENEEAVVVVDTTTRCVDEKEQEEGCVGVDVTDPAQVAVTVDEVPAGGAVIDMIATGQQEDLSAVTVDHEQQSVREHEEEEVEAPQDTLVVGKEAADTTTDEAQEVEDNVDDKKEDQGVESEHPQPQREEEENLNEMMGVRVEEEGGVVSLSTAATMVVALDVGGSLGCGGGEAPGLGLGLAGESTDEHEQEVVDNDAHDEKQEDEVNDDDEKVVEERTLVGDSVDVGEDMCKGEGEGEVTLSSEGEDSGCGVSECQSEVVECIALEGVANGTDTAIGIGPSDEYAVTAESNDTAQPNHAQSNDVTAESNDTAQPNHAQSNDVTAESTDSAQLNDAQSNDVIVESTETMPQSQSQSQSQQETPQSTTTEESVLMEMTGPSPCLNDDGKAAPVALPPTDLAPALVTVPSPCIDDVTMDMADTVALPPVELAPVLVAYDDRAMDMTDTVAAPPVELAPVLVAYNDRAMDMAVAAFSPTVTLHGTPPPPNSPLYLALPMHSPTHPSPHAPHTVPHTL